MKTASLVRRAILSVLLIEFLCALAFTCTSVWHEWTARLHALDASLQGLSDSLVGAVQDEEDPEAHVMVDPREFNPPSTDVYAVYNPDGHIVSISKYAPASLVSLGKDGVHNVTVEGRQYRVMQRNAVRIIDRDETGGVGRNRPVIVVYAVRTDHIWHEAREAVSFYALVSLILLCVTAGVLIFLLRRFLAPLQELATSAAAIKTDSPEFQPPPSVLRIHELMPLADALSKTITRLRLAFEKEQRFINDAAHELKTAVAVVRSTIQLLSMRSRTPEEYLHGLNQALKDNQRVEELVSQMLTLARASERTQEALVKADLAREAAAALETIASFAEYKGVQIVSSFAENANVWLPQNAAQILVSNLVMNAVQHSTNGSEVRVNVQSIQNGDYSAVLEVQDFGSGIAAENLPHVFDRFFREDPSRSRETGGAGLGLAICKGIVESAGGVIELQSVQGRGTTVKASFRPA